MPERSLRFPVLCTIFSFQAALVLNFSMSYLRLPLGSAERGLGEAVFFVREGGPQPQTLRAVAATSRSFCFWSSGEMRLPKIEEAKPHCGLSPSRSRGIYRAASRIRSVSFSRLSNHEVFVDARPSTTILSSARASAAQRSPNEH